MKNLTIGLLCVAAVCNAGLLFLTRNTPVTHPALKSTDLPPLMPTQAFYASPRVEYDYVVSNDGAYTISKKGSLTGLTHVVRRVSDREIIAEFPDGLVGIRWHPSETKVRFLFEGHDWEVDPFNAEPDQWVRTSPPQLSGGWVMNEYATDPEQPVLMWGRTNGSEPGGMWLVSQDGLETEKVATGNAKTQYWVFDKEQNPRLRVDARDASSQSLLRKDDGDWQQLLVLDLNDVFEPVSWVDENGKMLVRSSRGRDKAALVSFDIETGEEEVLIANPKGDVAFTTALTFESVPDVLRLAFDSLERVALTERGETFLNVLDQYPQPIALGATAGTPSGRYVTQAISPQSKSWIYLLIDLEEGTSVELDEFHMRRFKDRFVEPQAVRFTARDGLEIPAVLTMPRNTAGPIPFVVWVHGGPAGRTVLDYGHGTQFLVNRGYGVLSVNFRGSEGWGKAFQAAGFREFGRAMQDDISDAAKWLVAEGLADTDALAVMGFSYGGYSAAMAMTQEPGLFDAGIVEFPMLDVEFQSKYHPGYWNNGINGWWRYFGKVDEPDDLADMRTYSPINRVEALHGPLLILGGLRDQVTDIQQVRAFEAAAMEAGKDLDVQYFANAGHGQHGWRDDLRRGRLLEDFLAKHLGGRSGGFEPFEWAPEFID